MRFALTPPTTHPPYHHIIAMPPPLPPPSFLSTLLYINAIIVVVLYRRIMVCVDQERFNLSRTHRLNRPNLYNRDRHDATVQLRSNSEQTNKPHEVSQQENLEYALTRERERERERDALVVLSTSYCSKIRISKRDSSFVALGIQRTRLHHQVIMRFIISNTNVDYW